jgi:pimeloyl-ACP methyl ester carboxylesterase
MAISENWAYALDPGIRMWFEEQRQALAARSLIPLLFNEPPFWQGMGAWVLQNRFSAPGVQFLLTRLDPSSAFAPAQLRGLQPPTLLIWGQQDRIFPTEVDYFKQHLPPQTAVIEPAHFTHSPYLEAGMERELGQLMITWLKTLPTSP